MARRVKDEEYVIMPNQFGMDRFDLTDALGQQKENMCSADLKEFIDDNHLDTNNDGTFNPRLIFGSHDDQDHVYNTPRAWYMARYFNPHSFRWDGENADFTPESDNIPWSLVPERKIKVEDVKYILSSYYQGTEYNPYSSNTSDHKGMYRSIGNARTGVMTINQIRSDVPEEIKAVEWVCFGPNPFNAMIPLYAHTDRIPAYLSKVETAVDTSNFYWTSRLIAALAESDYASTIQIINRYQNTAAAKGRQLIHEYDKRIKTEGDSEVLIHEANERICKEIQTIASDTLSKVLLEASKKMKCTYNRADN